MKVEFLKEHIEKFLPIISKILPTHSQIPVLSNLLLQAEQKNGFSLSATDLELGARIIIPGKVEEEGATTIPGKQFIEIINSLPRGKVRLMLEKDQLVLSSWEHRMVFQTIAKEEFPSLFDKKGDKVYSFKEDEFRDIFSKLTIATSQDESRPPLTGIFVSQGKENVDFVATDGYRMSLKRLSQKNILNVGEGLILSSRLIAEALFLKGEEAGIDMFVYKEGNQVIFETKDIFLVGRTIGGEFPNYEKVMPVSGRTKVVVEKEEFLQGVRLASVFARESANIVRLKIEGGELLLLSKSSGVGEGEIKIDVEKSGDDNEIAFNVRFLLDLLKSIEEGRLTMQINSPLEPALFTVEKDPNFTHVIMPVRVQE